MSVASPHIRTSVSDLDDQVRFYTGVFGKAPAMLDRRGAVWITDDPPLRFEISADSCGSARVLGTGPA